MKYLIAIGTLLFLSSCASLMPKDKDLQEAPICKVWKPQFIAGLKFISDVEGEKAQYSGECSLWGCKKVYSEFKNGNEIYNSNSGLLKLETKIGRIEKQNLFLESPIGNISTMDLKTSPVSYVIELGGTKKTYEVQFNKNCSARQVALGISSLMAQN